MRDLLSRPWPWYVAGPLSGLVPGALLQIDNRVFGVSSTLRHGCAAIFSSFRIQGMFHLQGFHMFGVFATALPIAILTVQAAKH